MDSFSWPKLIVYVLMFGGGLSTPVFGGGAISTEGLIQSNETIEGIAYHHKVSTLYWVTEEGVYCKNSSGQSQILRLTGLKPTGLALDRVTENIYVSGLERDATGHEQSVIKVISSQSMMDVTAVISQTVITDLAIDSSHGLLFWCEYLKPNHPLKHLSTGRVIRSTMDGSSTVSLSSLIIRYPAAITLDPIHGRVYWADVYMESISSCDYNGEHQKLVVSSTNGQPVSISFSENHVSWTNIDLGAIHSQAVDSDVIKTQELDEHILTAPAVLEPELMNPCASILCNENGFCLLRDNVTATCSGLLHKYNSRCTHEQFRCSNGQCIFSLFKCDGFRHCFDGSDEDPTCVRSSFKNRNSQTNLDKSSFRSRKRGSDTTLSPVLPEKTNNIQAIRPLVDETLLTNPCASAPCGSKGICLLLRDASHFTCQALNDDSSFAQSLGPSFLIVIQFSLILMIEILSVLQLY